MWQRKASDFELFQFVIWSLWFGSARKNWSLGYSCEYSERLLGMLAFKWACNNSTLTQETSVKQLDIPDRLSQQEETNPQAREFVRK